MPNVGFRKRKAPVRESTTLKKLRTMGAGKPRLARPYGAVGGTGAVRQDQFEIINRKWDNVITLKKTQLSATNQAGLGTYYSAVNYQNASVIPDWAYMKALFKQYKLIRVKYTFTILDTAAGDGKAFTNTRLPEIFCRYNYDPNLAAPVQPTTFQQMNNVVSFQMTPEKTRFEYVVKPKLSRPLMITPQSATVGYEEIAPRWIDSQFDTVPHYGVWWYVDYLDTSFSFIVDVEYDIQLKQDQ